MMNISEILKKYAGYTNDQIIDMYIDAGAMGQHMDCSEEDFQELTLVHDIRCCNGIDTLDWKAILRILQTPW